MSTPLVSARQPLLFDPINLLTQERLTGDWGGVRPFGESNGVSFTGQLVNDLLWNTTRGISRGGADDGLLQFGAQVDAEKTIGLPGGTFKNTWFWLYGRNPTGFVGDVNGVSGIAGNPALRCYELWYDQYHPMSGFDDALSLRAGLLGLDAEFFISDPALLFVNGTFGMPALISQNLANSGPQYPMATPGVRLALHPFSWLRLRGAVTQANPFSQEENLHNFNWNFGSSGGLLSMNEAEVTWGAAATSGILPGKAKAGFWIQNGPSAGMPEQWSFGPPSTVTHCTGFYGIWDQTLYRPTALEKSSSGKKAVVPADGAAGDDSAEKGLKSFLRLGFSPQAASPLSFYTDGGFVYTGLIPTRPQDKLGLAFCYGSVNPAYRALGNQQGVPSASFESVTELT